MKKCLELFAEIAEKKDDYKKFYEKVGKCLKLEELKAEFELLTTFMKEVLGDKIEKVMVSGRTADFAVCADHLGVRLVCEHGTHHEGAGDEEQSHTLHPSLIPI